MFNKKLFIINNLEFYKIIQELKDYIDFKINHFDNWENFHKCYGFVWMYCYIKERSHF